MKKCPDCGRQIADRATKCSECGWGTGAVGGTVPYRWAMKVDGEWVDLQCAFNDYGQRCEHYGTMSQATNGHGPWYCRRHFGQTGIGRQDAAAYAGPETLGQHQVRAAAFCELHGLHTVDKMRDYVRRQFSKIGTERPVQSEPGELG